VWKLGPERAGVRAWSRARHGPEQAGWGPKRGSATDLGTWFAARWGQGWPWSIKKIDQCAGSYGSAETSMQACTCKHPHASVRMQASACKKSLHASMYMQASARNNTSACKHAHASIRMQAPACASTGGAHTAATLAGASGQSASQPERAAARIKVLPTLLCGH